MNHRTYDGQRFRRSPINATTSSPSTRLCGSASGGAGTSSTRRRRWRRTASSTSRTHGRALQDRRQLPATPPHRLAHGPQAGAAAPERGAALWATFSSPPPIARDGHSTDKETGKVGWRPRSRYRERSHHHHSAARHQGQGHRRRRQQWGRIRDWIAALDAAPASACAEIHRAGAGEPVANLERPQQCLADRWRPVWVTGTYDRTPTDHLGNRQPVPMFDPTTAGDNLYTNSAISWDPDSRMNWYFQYTPGDQWTSTRPNPHPDRRPVAGPASQAHHPFGPQRFRLHDGPQQRPDHWRQALHGQHQLDDGIDQKTGKPLDYDPARTSRPIRA